MNMNKTTMEQVQTLEFTNRTQLWRGVFSPLLSFAALDLFLIVNLFLITIPVCLLGVFTNIANIIVYYKMGFSESSKANFLVLSVFDFFLSFFSLVGRGTFSPLLRGVKIGPDTEIVYIGHSLSPVIIVSICGSAIMTALIATERCVCVVFPLKVKALLTRRRSLYLMLIVVFYHLAFLILIYADTGPPYDKHPPKKTFYYLCMYIIPSTTCYFFVVLSTIILIFKVRKNQRWRQQTASQATKSSNKEDKLVKTIIAISTLFIVCSFPNVAIYLGQIIYPPFFSGSPYFGTLVLLLFDIAFDFQAISSSMNIFFYYTISSKFKKVFATGFFKRFGEVQ